MENIKLVAVGDGGVGKTSLLITYFTKKFPDVYTPTVLDNCIVDVTVRGKPYSVALWDTGGGEDYPRLRPLSYPDTDVFLLCFAVDNQESLSNITTEWLPELYHHAPGVPIILVATKIDLRKDPNSKSCISSDQGYNVAKQNNMYYMETSALKQHGIKELFHKVIDVCEICGPATRQTWETWRKRNGRFHFGRSKAYKPVPLPPIMPPADKTPWPEIETSKYGDQMATALQDPQAADVMFLVEGDKEVKCHKVILCSACNYFCSVFGISGPVEQDEEKIPFKFTWSIINRGEVAGLSSIAEIENEDGQLVTQIGISDDISLATFSHVLEFLYTGLPKLEGADGRILKELRRVSEIFYLPQLSQVVDNIVNDEASLNPSIGTYLNHRMGQRAKAMFLEKETFSDIKFNVQGVVIPAHKVMLMARCDVMAGMFGGLFAERSKEVVTLNDEDQKCFTALLEYLYTDYTPIEDSDSVGILTMADRYGQERLKNLSELYIANEIDRDVKDHIAKADIDVIELLHGAQFHNATQLANWCLHFISSNYLAFTERSEFTQLNGDNLNTSKRTAGHLYLIWKK
ncbi:rho-related protein racA-like isoform X2 [Amphiura filiformis]|uniref:rho-related protein racA-like isoform X2 n=1 Tax=Amphiura filiformis TaxID=82378 RepID=UPI003B21F44E